MGPWSGARNIIDGVIWQGGVHMQYDRGPAALAESPGPARAPRLLDEVRRRLRLKRYSLRTEQAYLYWIRCYIRTNGLRHPREIGGAEVELFLSNLVRHDRVAPTTRNQALSALLFLYREVLAIDFARLHHANHPLAVRHGHRHTGGKEIRMDVQGCDFSVLPPDARPARVCPARRAGAGARSNCPCPKRSATAHRAHDAT